MNLSFKKTREMSVWIISQKTKETRASKIALRK
jgi:hypothetical protein